MMEKILFWALFLLLGNFCLAEKPENISCILYYKKNFTCIWSSEKEVYPTIYTVYRTNDDPGRSALGERDTCTSENRTSCSFFFPKLMYPGAYSIEVKAKNSFGEHKSKVTSWCLEKIVKIEPPTILTVKPIPGVKDMLEVAWRKPEGVPYSKSYVCQLRYRRVNNANWKLFSQRVKDERPHNITGLRPLRQYAVSMRCCVNDSELWSSWSEERIGTTEGLAPNSSLDLWRVLGPVQPDGRRTVQLLWKEAEVEPNVRKTHGYNIWYFPENDATAKKKETTANQQFRFHLGSGAYLVSVAYYTSDGLSPEATLRIPAVHEKPLQCIEAVKVNQSQDHLEMEWQTSDADIDRWVIEWYPDLETENLKRSWEFVSQTRNWTIRADNFEPFQCYNISVYPVVGVDVGVPHSIQAYFKEGIPLEGPLAKAQNINTQRATIKWEEIPRIQRRGFIRNYTVFYKSDHGEEIARTVNANILQYELESLERNTQYTVRVMANTLAGGKNGTSFNFRTLSMGVIQIVFLASIIGSSLVFLCILVMVCNLAKPKLKRLVCPEIPNPAKSKVVLWHGDRFKSKLHLREVQFHDKMKAEDERILKPYLSSSGDLIDKLVIDFENFLEKTEVHRVDMMKMQENILSGEKKYVNSTYNFYSPSGQVFQGLPPSTLISLEGTQDQCSESSDEEAKNRPSQRPSGILEPEQQPWEEAGLNPYLKNSVTTREFLTSDPTKKTEVQP